MICTGSFYTSIQMFWDLGQAGLVLGWFNTRWKGLYICIDIHISIHT